MKTEIQNRSFPSGLLLLAMLWLMVQPAGRAFAWGRPDLKEMVEEARDRVYPALINISCKVHQYQGGKKRLVKGGVGSGAIISKDGLAFTNYHVAGRAKEIEVTLWNQKKVPATLVGGDAWTDIALIRLDLEKYEGEFPDPVEFADPESCRTGQFVIAMGSPLGLARSMSFGVISNLNRYVGHQTKMSSGEVTGIFNNWIQTDAAVNPGNSGGPLVNLAGKVVGINSRAAVSANNIGLAIPAATAIEIIAELEEHGEVTRSYFGVEAKETRGLEVGMPPDKGVLIADVEVGSPAEEAGLLPADRITHVNGEPENVTFPEEIHPFYYRLAHLPLEKPSRFRVIRNEQVLIFEITPTKLPDSVGVDSADDTLKMTIRTVPAYYKKALGLEDSSCIQVTSVDGTGPAGVAGIQQADLILQLNGQPCDTIDEFKKIASEIGSLPDGAIAKIYRGSGQIIYAHIKLYNGEQEE